MKHKVDSLLQWLLSLFYAFILLALMGEILYNKTPYLEVLAMAVAFCVLISLVFLSRISAWIFFGLVAVLSLATTYVCWVTTPISKPVLDVVEGIMTLWYRIGYNIPFEKDDAYFVQVRIFMLLSALIIAVFIHVFFRRKFNFYILTASSLAMFFFSWLMSGKENKLLFIAFCLFTVLSYVRHVYKKKDKMGLVIEKVPLGSFMLLTIPVALIPVVTVALIPKHDQPLAWPWLDQKIIEVIDHFEQRYSYTDMEYFSLSSTGFNGDPHRLGGPIRPNNVIVMDVKTDKRTYIRGAAYLDYTGSFWIKDVTEEDEAPVLYRELEQEAFETSNGWLGIPVDDLFKGVSEDDSVLLSKLSEGALEELLFPSYPMEVRFRNMSTRTVFLPLKSIMPVEHADGTPMFLMEDMHGNAVADQRLPMETVYKLKYMQPMYGEPLLKTALTYSRKGLYRDALNYQLRERQVLLNDYNSLRSGFPTLKYDAFDSDLLETINNKIDLLMQLIMRAQRIQRDYTRLNVDIPQRVRDLALELTNECKSDYEKVVQIENYLRNNFTYTLEPGMVPDGWDFVDYFLFEDRQGYCTYYASAMTVMLRSIGIPARYVEGYVLPEDSNKDQIFTVTNRNAHAWVEVYFEGFGWLTFEPTSIYADTMNYRNESFNVTDTYYPYFPDELEELMERYAPRRNTLDRTIDDVQADNTGMDTVTVILIIVGILAAIILANLIAILAGDLRIRWLKPKKKVLAIYELILKWFSLVGYTLRPGETAGDFSKRISGLYFFTTTSFTRVTDVFVKVRYGNQEVSADEIQMLQQFLIELKKVILTEIGIRRYIPLRRILLGI